MKKIAFGIACGLVAIFVFLMMLTLYGRTTRQNEVEQTLAQAIDATLSEVMREDQYTIKDSEDFTSDFLQALLIQIDSDADVSVSVLDADENLGTLSVEITEKYRHPNGQEGSVSQVRTVVFEEGWEAEAEYHTVSFYTGDEELYKEYSVKDGAACALPLPPEKEGETFLCWRFVTGGAGSVPADAALTITEDIRLLAVFE